jgi:hypothetical protein
MELHLAIKKVLEQHSKAMTVKEITDAINDQGLCTRRDGTAVCYFQIHGRSFNRKELFEREGEWVKLKKPE